MKVLIIIEYFINLILSLLFYMHMFQLNSYFFIKYVNWIKDNKEKILLQILGIILVTILLRANTTVCNVVAILYLGVLIFSNIPKSKAKIEFKI